MNILISGATGFIGTTLIPLLQSSEHRLFALVRKLDNRLPDSIQQYTLATLTALDVHIDAFINLAGEGIADKAWSDKRKQALYQSRVGLTEEVQKQLNNTPNTVISMSAIGYYGSMSNEEFDEFSPPQDGFAHELCAAWEKSALAFSTLHSRVVLFRLGVVLGPNGGALRKMRPSYLMGLGGRIGKGDQWFSWVHVNDVVRAIVESLSDETFEGAYNLVSPGCVQQKIFAQHYANSLHRPAFFTIPSFVFNMIFGEMASLLTHGAKVKPKRLKEQSFVFQYEDLTKALMDIKKYWGR